MDVDQQKMRLDTTQVTSAANYSPVRMDVDQRKM
jgi:hypothetical protein